jgi:hypothetical protein
MEFVEGLVDKSARDVVLDYQRGMSGWWRRCARRVPEGQKLMHALDVVSGKGSYGEYL